jgi:hypothetical protein
MSELIGIAGSSQHSTPGPSKVSDEYYKDGTVRRTRCEQFVSLRVRQQTHRRAEEQRENDQYAHSVQKFAVVVIHRSGRACCARVSHCSGEIVQQYDGHDQEDEYDQRNDRVDESVNP